MNKPQMSQIERTAHSKGYRVSPDGLTVTSPYSARPRKLSEMNGYLHFTVVNYSGEHKNCRVHRLQAYQKFGEAIYEPGIEVRHLDGKQNNAADKIELGTPVQNAADKDPAVVRRCALNAAEHARKHDVADVRAFYAVSKSYRLTMAQFGITSTGTLHYVLNGSKKSPLSPPPQTNEN